MRRRAPRPLAAALEGVLERAEPATTLARVQRVWPRVAGSALADSARPVAERDGVVTVACESAVWANELQLLAGELLPRLNAALAEPGASANAEAGTAADGDPGTAADGDPGTAADGDPGTAADGPAGPVAGLTPRRPAAATGARQTADGGAAVSRLRCVVGSGPNRSWGEPQSRSIGARTGEPR